MFKKDHPFVRYCLSAVVAVILGGLPLQNTIVRLLDTYTITGFVNFSDPLIAIVISIFVHGMLLCAIICSEEYSSILRFGY